RDGQQSIAPRPGLDVLILQEIEAPTLFTHFTSGKDCFAVDPRPGCSVPDVQRTREDSSGSEGSQNPGDWVPQPGICGTHDGIGRATHAAATASCDVPDTFACSTEPCPSSSQSPARPAFMVPSGNVTAGLAKIVGELLQPVT